jgi:hypothetical protein
LFIVRESKDRDGPWKLWDMSFFNFGELLKFHMDNLAEDSDYDKFPRPKDGYTLEIGFKEATTGSNTYLKAAAISFKSRKPLDYDPEEMPCLDDLLIVPSYDELRKIHFQLDEDDEEHDRDHDRDHDDTPVHKVRTTGDERGNGSPNSGSPGKGSPGGKSSNLPASRKYEDSDEGSGEDDEKETPAQRRKATSGSKDGSKDGSEESEKGLPNNGLPEWLQVGRVVYYKGMECEIKKVSKDGKTLTLEDEDQDEHLGVDPKKCKPYEKDEEEEPAPRKRK